MSPPVPAASLPLGLLTLLGLLTACTLLGWGIRRLAVRAARGSRATLFGLALDLATGLLALHLLLLGLQALGIRWTTLSVGGSLGLALALLVLARRVLAPPTSHPKTGETQSTQLFTQPFTQPFTRPFTRSLPRFWGNAVALLAVLVFTAAAWTLRATHPDFIYHWGIKAKKFLLAGGLDLRYLGRTWNHFVHPDYPTLVPELHTVTSLPGGFSEPALLLGSVVLFAALLVAVREALHRSARDPFVQQAGLAFLALGLTAFAVGHRLAGGADLPLAFAFAAALPTLLAPHEAPHAQGSDEADRDDWSLGIAAAFAAAVKIEGVLLAATLVSLHGLRRWREGRLGLARRDGPTYLARLARLARIALPSLAVVLPWLAIDLRYGLFQPFNSGTFEPERGPGILSALADGLAVRHWHGLSYLVLAAPLLLLARRTRLVATVVLVQLVFYLWVFFTLVGDAEQLVRLSLPRLLLPLVPAVVVAGLVLLPGRSDGNTVLPIDLHEDPR